MSKLPRFRVVFEEEASEFVLTRSKRQQRRLMDICYAIANPPSAKADFQLPDADGRPVSQVATEGFLVSYWVDSFSKRVVIAEIELEE